MAFTPPTSPVTNQIYSDGAGKNWVWDGTQWEPYNPPLGVAAVTSAGAFNAGDASSVSSGPLIFNEVTPALKTVGGVSLYGPGNVPVTGMGGGSYSGNTVLTTATYGAITVTSTDFGQYIKLPNATLLDKGANLYTIENTGDYVIKVLDASNNILGFIYPQNTISVSLYDNTTVAGGWSLVGADLVGVTAELYSSVIQASTFISIKYVALDTTRTLILFATNSSPVGIYAAVFDSSANVFGPITVYTAAGTTPNSMMAVLTDTDTVALIYGSTSNTVLIGSVLTITGLNVVFNPHTSSGTVGPIGSGNNAFDYLINTGGNTYAIGYFYSTNAMIYVVTFTVNANKTITFQVNNALGASVVSSGAHYMSWVGSALTVVWSNTSSQLVVTTYSLSAGTLTQIAQQVATTADTTTGPRVVPLDIPYITAQPNRFITLGASSTSQLTAQLWTVGAASNGSISVSALNLATTASYTVALVRSNGATIVEGNNVFFAYAATAPTTASALHALYADGPTLYASPVLRFPATVTLATPVTIVPISTGLAAVLVGAYSSTTGRCLMYVRYSVNNTVPSVEVISTDVFGQTSGFNSWPTASSPYDNSRPQFLFRGSKTAIILQGSLNGFNAIFNTALVGKTKKLTPVNEQLVTNYATAYIQPGSKVTYASNGTRNNEGWLYGNGTLQRIESVT